VASTYVSANSPGHLSLYLKSNVKCSFRQHRPPVESLSLEPSRRTRTTLFHTGAGRTNTFSTICGSREFDDTRLHGTGILLMTLPLQ
jgi:hypothetical protein